MATSRTRVLVEMALSIALAYVLGRFAMLRMPAGGSISLSMLPLFVFALRRGLAPGLAAGAVYGLLDLTLDPYVINWTQLVLDYPLAYTMIGSAGALGPVWRREVSGRRTSRAVWTVAVPAIVLGSVLRLYIHWLSGVVFFGQFAGDQPVWLYSLVYNLTYVGPSVVLCAAAAVAVLPGLERAVPVR
jgi:thiamine transporter